MPRYTGLPDKLRREVDDRDGSRCRWCGVTNRGRDIHHIRYRRGTSYDVIENLISLCRGCHSFVHGLIRENGDTITKPVAQGVLQTLVNKAGVTGEALWRSKKATWAKEGLCEHGQTLDLCPFEKVR